jgi:NADPH2:quinone reductase
MPTAAKALVMHQTGDPDVLQWQEVQVPDPGPGEVLLRHTAVGLNFIDISHRRGSYPTTFPLPAILGMEGAGVIEAVGDGVTGFAPGDRVSYCMTMGSFAELRTIPADRLIRLPGHTSEETAAASTLQGLTAHYLLHESYAVQPGDKVLVHAAAGGMGLLLCQWAKAKGAEVFGTVSTEAKAETARAHGCDHPILYTQVDFVDAVMGLTGGQGVRVVYDAIGKDTFLKGFDALASRGHLVSYGQSSGAPDPLNVGPLAAKSLTLTRGGLNTFIRDPAERQRNAETLWNLVADGTLKVQINQRYPLSEGAKAHEAMENRRTTGSTVLEV